MKIYNFQERPRKTMPYVKVLQYIEDNPNCSMDYFSDKEMIKAMFAYGLVDLDNGCRLSRAGKDVLGLVDLP